MHARKWDGNADRIDFVKVRCPLEEAPLTAKVSTLLSMDWSSGKTPTEVIWSRREGDQDKFVEKKQ
jgi:hypothetical protein